MAESQRPTEQLPSTTKATTETQTPGPSSILFNETTNSTQIQYFKAQCDSQTMSSVDSIRSCLCCPSKGDTLNLCGCFQQSNSEPRWIASTLSAVGHSNATRYNLSVWNTLPLQQINILNVPVMNAIDHTTFNYISLRNLSIVNCKLKSVAVPKEAKLERVDLSDNNMSDFPSSLFTPSLLAINLSGNAFNNTIPVLDITSCSTIRDRFSDVLDGQEFQCLNDCKANVPCRIASSTPAISTTPLPVNTLQEESSSAGTIIVIIATAILLLAIAALLYCRRRMLSAAPRQVSASTSDQVMSLFTLTRAVSQSKLESESSFVFLDTGRADIVLLDHSSKFDGDFDSKDDFDDTVTNTTRRLSRIASHRRHSLDGHTNLSFVEPPKHQYIEELEILEAADVKLVSQLATGSSMWSAKYELRPAVLKKMNPREIGEIEMNHFIADMNAIAKLTHPHIVKLYGIVHLLEDVCVVAEYMERGSLGILLHQSSTAFKWHDQLRMCWEVASALTFVHSQSNYMRAEAWTTRDILVNALLTCKLNPFNYMTEYRQNVPSVEASYGRQVIAYDAPEVLAYDCARSSTSDMYTLGVILAEIATRHLPYQNWINEAGYVSCDVKILLYPDQKPHESSSAFHTTPYDFQAIVSSCLQRDVLKRPLALNVADELRRMLDDTEENPPPPPPPIDDTPLP